MTPSETSRTAGPPAGWPCAAPILKWTGGKGSELGEIGSSLPPRFDRLLEPFLGGGAVLFATPPDIPAEVNDLSADLVALYRALRKRERATLACVGAIERAWTAVGRLEPGEASDDGAVAATAGIAAAPLDALRPGAAADVASGARTALDRKRRAMARIAGDGGEVREPAALLRSALTAAVYTAVRSAYNAAPPGPARRAAFWFLREFCYAGMFRSNAAGGFNVPYGGMSYDRRSMAHRLRQLAEPATAARLEATRFHRGDFARFLEAAGPRPGDFVFLDPPYDSPFSTYDRNAFGRADHARLARAMAGLPCAWMMVVGDTPFVRETYLSLPGARSRTFGKNYRANIKGRVDTGATHLVITNYPTARDRG